MQTPRRVFDPADLQSEALATGWFGNGRPSFDNLAATILMCGQVFVVRREFGQPSVVALCELLSSYAMVARPLLAQRHFLADWASPAAQMVLACWQ